MVKITEQTFETLNVELDFFEENLKSSKHEEQVIFLTECGWYEWYGETWRPERSSDMGTFEFNDALNIAIKIYRQNKIEQLWLELTQESTLSTSQINT